MFNAICTVAAAPTPMATASAIHQGTVIAITTQRRRAGLTIERAYGVIVPGPVSSADDATDA
jgi:hypothetical protein